MIRDAKLFHLALLICLKFRGGNLVGRWSSVPRGGYGCDPKMGLRCISLRLLTCGYVRHLLVVRIAQNAVDFSVFKGVGSQVLGDRRLA